MPRGGSNADVRWFEIAPCYVFHPLNAYEDEQGGIVMDVARYPELWRQDSSASWLASLHRWRIDLRAGRVSEGPLDDHTVEFPRFDERRAGRAHRYGYAVGRAANRGTGTTLVKYDLGRGVTTAHDFGSGHVPDEPVFVPASPTSAEDEGWLLSYVYDAGRGSSDLVILDGADFSGKPVATASLPQRVPFGFHGSFIPDQA